MTDVTSTIDLIGQLLGAAASMITWAISTWPINLAVVAMVTGTASAMVGRARRDMLGN